MNLKKINFMTLLARYRAPEGLSLPPYAGSAIRGVFGMSLKESACAVERVSCNGCILAGPCTYFRLFETVEKAGDGHSESLLHPFVLTPVKPMGGGVECGGEFEFEVRLIGSAVYDYPMVVNAFIEIEGHGLGANRRPVKLISIIDGATGEPVVALSNKTPLRASPTEQSIMIRGPRKNVGVEIEFVTPVRIKHEGLINGDLNFDSLLSALIRRANGLARHCGYDPGIDNSSLLELAKTAKTSETALKYVPFARYSNRQQKKIEQPGLIGKMTLENVPGAFVPLLRLGEALHVGKGTSMGLGKYRMSAK